jgi:hypothetical protein
MAEFIEFLNAPKLFRQKIAEGGDFPKTIFGCSRAWGGVFLPAGGARFYFCSCWGCASFSYFLKFIFYLSDNPIFVSRPCDSESAKM